MRTFLLTCIAIIFIVFHVEAQKAAPKSAAVKHAAVPVKSQPGYNIPITLTPLKNCWVYLGCHFGKFKNLADSTWLDVKSQGTFKGKAKLPGGIYFVVSPRKVLLFELLMDNEQHFSIKADTLKPDVITITGSPENQLFQQYTQYLAQKAPILSNMQRQLGMATTPTDSALIRSALNKGNKELQDYREGLMSKNPKSMLASFFHTMKRPEIPEMPKLANGNVDSAYPYRFVKGHWWDGVSLDDDRLVRTPFFEPKLDEYFKYYVPQDADSITAEANYMLLVARNSKEMFKYLLGKFTDKYINPEYMGQEKVFLFLFDKYYSKGDTAWLSQKQKQYIFDRAYSLMANQLGEAAADMQLVDTSDKPASLYAIKAPFTFISFWDPNCGHCKETMPRVDSIYRAKWKALGVKIVGVNVDDAANDAWKKFIVEHNLEGWAHMYQPRQVKEDEAKKGVPNFRQLYDVFKTPTLYLLDDQKRIIGKMLTIEQFDDVLTAKIKNKKPGS